MWEGSKNWFSFCYITQAGFKLSIFLLSLLRVGITGVRYHVVLGEILLPKPLLQEFLNSPEGTYSLGYIM